MTYEVPPPPGPPAQPPNAGGRPGGSFDPASVNRLDWAILGAGLIVFIFSFFNYYSWDFSSYGIHLSKSWGAWHWDHGLFIAWFAMALSVAGAGILALSIFAPTVQLPAAPRVLTLLAFGISFVLYVIGFVFFVGSLQAGHYKFQFTNFAWTHMALYLIVVQAHFIMNNIFEGMIWFLLPAALVITNDIGAYIVGITFGRTQLIKLSPKKTVEGFVGAWIITIVFGFFYCKVLMRYSYFICPVTVSLLEEVFLGSSSR